MAVAKEIKETIAVTIDEVFKKMNSLRIPRKFFIVSTF